MIDLIFEYATELVIVRIQGKSITFATSALGLNYFAPIESIKLSVKGILKEYPELAGKPEGEIRMEGIRKLKEKLNNFEGENEIKKYVIEELERQGYILKSIKRQGFREAYIR